MSAIGGDVHTLTMPQAHSVNAIGTFSKSILEGLIFSLKKVL